MNEQIISTESPVVKPCIKCGAVDRNKRGDCRPCHRERVREYREANRDKVRENNRKWRDANPEKFAACQRKWREANKEKSAERNRKWRETNRDRDMEVKRKYREANKERAAQRDRKWQKANPEKVAERNRKWKQSNSEKVKAVTQNRRAKIKGSGGKLSTDIVQTLLIRQSNKCACCGADLMQTGYHLDHIMPLALGGANDDSNVQLLTPKCNLSKGAKHPDVWAKEKGITLS